jgi:hypothetical protein
VHLFHAAADADMGEAEGPGASKSAGGAGADPMQITPSPSFHATAAPDENEPSPRATSVAAMIHEIEQRCAELNEPELRQVCHAHRSDKAPSVLFKRYIINAWLQLTSLTDTLRSKVDATRAQRRPAPVCAATPACPARRGPPARRSNLYIFVRSTLCAAGSPRPRSRSGGCLWAAGPLWLSSCRHSNSRSAPLPRRPRLRSPATRLGHPR